MLHVLIELGVARGSGGDLPKQNENSPRDSRTFRKFREGGEQRGDSGQTGLSRSGHGLHGGICAPPPTRRLETADVHFGLSRNSDTPEQADNKKPIFGEKKGV